MNYSKIAVMAGTHVDTEFGIDLLKELTDNIIPLPISNTPEEQTIFQTLDYSYRFNYIKEILSKHKDINCLLVYCNSLSSTVDFEMMGKEVGINIVTPLKFYKYISKKYNLFGLISANAQGSAGIEKNLLDSNPDAHIYSVANLDWVKAIEDRINSEIIFNELGLKEIVKFYEKIGVDCIILGCTHFPYFQKYLQKQTKITCLSADNYILEKVKDFIYDK